MLYLASQFVWFLVAALALGFVMGWLGQDGGKRRLWHPGLGYLAAIWGLTAAIVWTQTLNGVAALWVESGLLFVAAYAAGCVLGALAHPALPMQAQATSAIEGAAAPAKTATSAPDAAKAAMSELKPIGETAPDLAKVENEDAIPGRRPAGLVAARNQAPDDLKIIKGIGPQNEGRLHALGIWHFEQIAAWTPENVEWVGSYLAFPGRIEREDWIEQARVLAAEPSKAPVA